MNVRESRWQRLAAFAAVSATMLVLAGCQGSGSNTAANSGGANNSNNPELFTIPQDQMSHVQVLTVQPTTLTRSLRLTGAVAYNSFRTTPVITQVSGTGQPGSGGSRRESNAGRTHVVCGESRLFAAPHQLSEGQGCIRFGAKGFCPSAGPLRTSRDCRTEFGAGAGSQNASERRPGSGSST